MLHAGQQDDWNPTGFGRNLTEELKASQVMPAATEDHRAVGLPFNHHESLVRPSHSLDFACREALRKDLPHLRRAMRVRLDEQQPAAKAIRRFMGCQDGASLRSTTKQHASLDGD